MEISQVLIVPVILALMTAVKAAPWFAPTEPDGPRRNGWLLPWIAAALGVAVSLVWNSAWPADPAASLAAQAVFGFLMGLSAAGLYDGAIQPLKGKGPALGGMGGMGGVGVLLIAALLLPMLAGCQASAVAREAQAWELAGIQTYAANTRTIHKTWASIYRMQRQAAVDQVTQQAIDLVKAKATTPDLVEEGIKAVILERDAALAQTEQILKRMEDLANMNEAELAKLLRIHGAMSEWLAAGIDSSAIPGMIDEVAGILQSLRPAVPAPGP